MGSFAVLCFFPLSGSRCFGYQRYTQSRTAQRPSDRFHRRTVLRSFNGGVKADKNGRVALRATRSSCPTRGQRLAFRFIPATQRLTVRSTIKPSQKESFVVLSFFPRKTGGQRCGYKRSTRSRMAQRSGDYFHRIQIYYAKAIRNERVTLRATRRPCPAKPRPPFYPATQ